MDVNFPGEAESLNPDILIQQMVDCQNSINAASNNKLNGYITDLKNKLQDYLNRYHPGLAAPQDGPHFQVMMQSFEEIALLHLDMMEFTAKVKECPKDLALTALYPEIDSYYYDLPKADAPLLIIKEKRPILEYIGNKLVVRAQKRLEFERNHWKIATRVEKLLALAKNIDDNDNDASSGGEDDHFLGILRKGIYSLRDEGAYKASLQDFVSSRELWTLLKVGDEATLKWVCYQTEVLDLAEKEIQENLRMEGVLGKSEQEPASERDKNGANGFNSEPMSEYDDDRANV